MISLATRKIEEMRDVMFDSKVHVDQEDAYWVVRDPGQNITIIPPFELGREFPKTYGHFHKPRIKETYKVLFGRAGLIVQKGIEKVEEVRFTKGEAGDTLVVRSDFDGHVLVNIGDTALVVVDDDRPENSKHLYDPIKSKRGLAYYVVRSKDGGVEFAPNPSYSKVPPLARE